MINRDPLKSLLCFLHEKSIISFTQRALLFFVIPASFCSPVPVPDNGAVQGFRYELGATLRITCNNGYNLVPSSSSFRTCISDGAGGGLWSGGDPVCECKIYFILRHASQH